MTCDECKHFQIIQEPIRTEGTIFDFGRVRCKKHNLISDFCSISHKEFEHLETCEDFEEGRKTMRRDEFPIIDKHVKNEINAVLDKIRAEICEKRSKENCSCSDCLDIIDKYREGEES